jgi:DNA-directed RNA polymerase alpha subunit
MDKDNLEEQVKFFKELEQGLKEEQSTLTKRLADIEIELEIMNKNKIELIKQGATSLLEIDDIWLRCRSYNCLKRAGIKNASQIKSKQQLMKIPELGKKSLCDIVECLRDYGIELPESED